MQIIDVGWRQERRCRRFAEVAAQAPSCRCTKGVVHCEQDPKSGPAQATVCSLEGCNSLAQGPSGGAETSSVTRAPYPGQVHSFQASQVQSPGQVQEKVARIEARLAGGIPTPFGRRALPAHGPDGQASDSPISSRPGPATQVVLADVVPLPAAGIAFGVTSDMVDFLVSQHDPWSCSCELPSLSELLPVARDGWLAFPVWDGQQPLQAFYCFTDGSFFASTSQGGWSLVMLGLCEQSVVRVGIIGARVRTPRPHLMASLLPWRMPGLLLCAYTLCRLFWPVTAALRSRLPWARPPFRSILCLRGQLSALPCSPKQEVNRYRP